MEAFDKVEELLLAEGYSKEEIPAIMVSLVEQGFDPTAVFLGGIANMLDLLPKKKTTPKVQPKVTTTSQTGGPLGTRTVPTLRDLGGSVKPDGWGGFPKQPPVTKAPTTTEPQFRTTQPTNNVTPRRNNLSLQRTNLRAPSIPKPPAAVSGLFGRLKGIRGGPLTTAVNLATGAALDKYVVQPVAKAGGSALTRTILDITGQGNRARQIAPSLYGKSGPDLTPEIKTGIQQRSKLAQQSAETQAASQPKPQPTGERSAAANAEKQELAKAEAQRRREAATPKPLSAAAKDFDKTFAAKRAAGEKEFTWRGKKYTTKLKGE